MGLESKPGCPASDPLTVTRGPADGALSGSREEHGEARHLWTYAGQWRVNPEMEGLKVMNTFALFFSECNTSAYEQTRK